jgi:hypothetical protein
MKVSLLRLDRYHSWRQMSSTKLPPFDAAAAFDDPLQRSTSVVVRSSTRKRHNRGHREQQQRCRNLNDLAENEAGGAAKDSAAAAAALEPTQSSCTSSSSLEKVEDAAVMVIVATPQSRQIMRHISGLGMEDPTTYMAQAQSQAQASDADESPNRRGRRKSSTEAPALKSKSPDGKDDGVNDRMLVFQDMKLADLPKDMRSILSVESDPTARLPPPPASSGESGSGGDTDPAGGTYGIGIDMEMFHSSLGHLDAVLHGYDDDDTDEDPGRADQGPGGSAALRDPPHETEQLLRSLPDSGEGAGHSSRSRDKEASAMEQAALLGASLSSLQSLSLEELQKPATLKSSGMDPRLFLEAASSTRSMLVTKPGGLSPQGREGSTPLSSSQQLSRDDHHRFHSSMPLHVKVLPTPAAANALSSSSSLLRKNARPALLSAPFSPSGTASRHSKLRYRAPPSITSLCPLPEAAKLPSPVGKGGAAGRASKDCARAAAAVAAVAVPRMRALPSLHQLFPGGDGDQPKESAGSGLV